MRCCRPPAGLKPSRKYGKKHVLGRCLTPTRVLTAPQQHMHAQILKCVPPKLLQRLGQKRSSPCADMLASAQALRQPQS